MDLRIDAIAEFRDHLIGFVSCLHTSQSETAAPPKIASETSVRGEPIFRP
jgi:hypothetical protein